MFCGNCGKQNPDNAKFCSSCGSKLNSAPVEQAAPVHQAPSAQQTAPVHQAASVQQPVSGKKITLKRILVSIVVFFVASAIGTAMAGLFTSLPDVEPSSTPSEAYSQIFWDNGLAIPGSDFAGQGLKTASYAISMGDGMVGNSEYVFEDGYVLAFIETMYVPVQGLDADTRAELNSIMESQVSAYTALSCCQLSSYEENGFYVYKLLFSDLDRKENVRELSGTGLIITSTDENEADRLGIKQTEENLLAQGYVKR